MGIRESKVSFLEYEEAVKRVSEEEIERLKRTFKCFTGNGSLLTKQVFTNDVLSGLVPTRLAEQLFLTCGGSQKGINFRDLLVLLVLITKGRVDEKVRFIFNLMSVDGSSITREDLENFYTACENNTTLPVCIHQAFWRNDNKLSFQEFHDWISTNPSFSTITIWLLEEQAGTNGIQLSSQEDKPSFYKSLASHSKLNEKEIIELEKRYWYLKSTSMSGRYDFELFKCYTSPPLPERFTKRFFDFFDKNNDDHIDFKEMVCGISTFCRGLTSERLEACFDMFDMDQDGMLNHEELKNMVDGLLEVYKQYDDNLELQVDTIMQELSKQDRSGGAIGLTGFRSWASTNTLIHEFLLLLSQICHIVFGLKPVLREEEGGIIRRWLDRQKKDGMKPGSFYYLIPSKWWNSWKDHVNFEKCGVSLSLGSDNATLVSDTNKTNDLKTPQTSEEAVTPSKSFKLRHNQVQIISNGHALKPPPSSIENNVLLQGEPAEYKKLYNLTGEGGRLKQNILLIDGKDYETLPEQVWRSMSMWYGADLELPRVVLQTSKSGQPELELYPIQFLLHKHSPPSKTTGFSLNSIGINNFLSQVFGGMSAPSTNNHEPPPLVTPKKVLTYKAAFSKENTVKQIVEFIGRKLKIHPDDLRLWIMKEDNENILLEEDEITVEDVPLSEGCHLLLEIRNRDLSWPEEMNSLVATRNFRERSNTGLLVKGATGLHNLGNTCFMNSAIQCLSNTKPLTEYFCSKLFVYELNRTNPLGMKGLLAKRYGDLVTDLWKGIYRSIAPVKLRWTIGRYAPRFNGFQQHDSQELLSFLLDGLHEDTNRVHDKPYVELKDSNGRPDTEVANEAWENHLKRNQSIIVDLFQGMLKSQVRCLHCGHTSIRFDPFTFLSLPLPMERSLHLEIAVFTQNREGIIKYGLLLPPDSTVLHARKELSKLCNIPVENLLLAEVVGFIIRNFLMDSQKLSTTAMGFLYAYEYTPYDEGYAPSPIHHSLSDTLSSTTSNNHNQQQQQPHNLISANIGNTTPDSFEEHIATNTSTKTNEHSSKNSTRSKSSKLKKTKHLFRPLKSHAHSKVVDVSSSQKLPEKESANNSTEVLEVPGIVNASFSTTQANGTSSVRSSASSECVWDSSFHGTVTAINRKTIQQTNYFLSWQKFRPVVFGVPCVLSIAEDTKNKDVYQQVFKHISRYITGQQHLQDNDNLYPFELKCVDKDGNYCVTCPWYRFCHGCKVPCNDEYFAFNSTYLAIDWDSTTLHLQYQQALEKNYTMDGSIDACYKLLQEPISVEQCLRDFTKEEELGDDETWYCCKCKEHRKIAKKFDIWKLPAILVIHLKRFQLVNNRWVKSNKLVRFPFENFNISPYVPHSSTSSSSNITEVKSCEEIPPEEVKDEGSSSSSSDKQQVEIEVEEMIERKNNNNYKYNLYAISCHAGMLNGGHYIAYTKNSNNKWYCYNDSSCKEVEVNLLENEAPYMLFYEMDKLKSIDYMPDIKNKEPIQLNQEEDDFDREVKKYCSVM